MLVKNRLLFLIPRRAKTGESSRSIHLLTGLSQLLFFLCVIFANKCSSLLIPVPIASSIRSENMCPDPVDWDKSYSEVVMNFHRNNVIVLETIHDNTSPPVVPCRFQYKKNFNNIDATLIAFEQRATPIPFGDHCSHVLEFPGRWHEVLHENSSGVRCEPEIDRLKRHEDNYKWLMKPTGQVLLEVSERKLIRWLGHGKIMFEEAFVPNPQKPILVLLFKSELGDKCELQIQQYFWTMSNRSNACTRVYNRNILKRHVCGVFKCTAEKGILKLMKGIKGDNLTVRDLPGDPKIRTLGYFLKGLILPLLISTCATIGYFIWRKQMKLTALRAAHEGISFGTQTTENNPIEESGVLIHFDEDDEEHYKDKPPTYESLLAPPTYEDAILHVPVPHHSTSNHLDDSAKEISQPLLGPDCDDKTLPATCTRPTDITS